MSIFNDKALKSVADAVAKVLANESSHELKGNQHKIDANKNGKIDAHDFKLLRSKKNLKEDDTGYQDRYAVKNGKAVKHNPARGERDEPHHVWADSPEHAVRKHAAKTAAPMKEEVEQVEDEMLQEGFADMEKYMKAKAGPKPSGGAGMKQGTRYGGGKQAPDVEDDEEDKKPARGKYGARQNFKRSVKEGFTGLINAYNHGGLKGLSENLVEEEILEEEPDNAQFTKELEDQKASMEGKKKQPSVAAPSTQGVKNMPEEVEVQEEVKDEYARKVDKYLRKKYNLTPDEKEEKEKNVKGMKKKLSGFKQRYGERAKEVMYATATKMAKKD